jgi:hypothetical protein
MMNSVASAMPIQSAGPRILRRPWSRATTDTPGPHHRERDAHHEPCVEQRDPIGERHVIPDQHEVTGTRWAVQSLRLRNK